MCAYIRIDAMIVCYININVTLYYYFSHIHYYSSHTTHALSLLLFELLFFTHTLLFFTHNTRSDLGRQYATVSPRDRQDQGARMFVSVFSVSFVRLCMNS